MRAASNHVKFTGPPQTSGPEESPRVYREIIDELRRIALTTEELATLTGVGDRQVYNWLNGTSQPSSTARDRLLEVHYIVRALNDVYTPEGVDIWLHGRKRSLGGVRPIDLLQAGQFETVLEAVERLKGGTA